MVTDYCSILLAWIVCICWPVSPLCCTGGFHWKQKSRWVTMLKFYATVIWLWIQLGRMSNAIECMRQWPSVRFQLLRTPLSQHLVVALWVTVIDRCWGYLNSTMHLWYTCLTGSSCHPFYSTNNRCHPPRLLHGELVSLTGTENFSEKCGMCLWMLSIKNFLAVESLGLLAS